ncbi:hypothetical protein FVEN_g13038 [Fusarium venenatum]|nr:hypothetical protein FVEN_g13038 [Fusarium venenatum]
MVDFSRLELEPVSEPQTTERGTQELSTSLLHVIQEGAVFPAAIITIAAINDADHYLIFIS